MKGKTYASLAVLGALSLLFPFQASAFGLGKLETSSALNEPFRGQIQVVSLRKGEFENLAVGLASSEEFNKAGIERPFLLSKLQFDVIQDDKGIVTIEIKSKRPIKEPFLDFLIVISTGQNRMLREYTVLLDPPTAVFVQIEPAKKTSAPVQKPVTPPPTKAKQAPVAAKTTSYQYPDASSAEMVSSYGPTDKYDTLWKLSSEVRTDKSVSVNQIMMAILKDNPDAFQRNNINGLKIGKTLSIPSVDKIKTLSRSQAVSAVREQNTRWKQSRKKAIASTTSKAEAKPVPAVIATTDSAEKVESSAADVSASSQQSGESTSTPSTPTSQLKLVAPSDEIIDPDNIELDASGSENIDKLSEQLTLAQETIAGQAQENIDFKARMDALEEQINTLHRLIEIKDADLARLQSNLEDDVAAEPAITENTLQAETTEGEEALLREQLAALEDEVSATSEDADAGDEATEPSPPSAIVDYVQPVTQAAPLPKSSSPLDNKNSMLGMIGQALSESKTQKLLGGVLILLILWLALRTRSKTEESWQEAAMGGGGAMRTEPEIDLETDSSNMAENSEITQNDDSEDEPIGERTHALVEEAGFLTVADLLAEADAYITYDNYPRAEVLLEKARTVEPENVEVGWKLLHVLFKQSRAEEFSKLAQELKTTIEADNPDKWSEICEWGRQIDPEYNLSRSEEDLSADEGMIIEDLSTESMSTVSTESADDDLEFDLGKFELEDPLTVDSDDIQSTAESMDSEKVEDDAPLNFDAPLELTTATNIEEIVTEEKSAASAVEESQLAESSEATEQSNNETEFLIDDVGDFNEVETKLDLALAFVDMGDPDGANAILEEVLLQGTDDQKARAQSILNTSAVEITSVEAGADELSIEELDIDNISEAETKLDLAIAYIDIDDTDGATTILKEIINEGDKQQKKRAQDLLDKI